MVQLIWTGTDEQEQYHDDDRGVTYWPSERPVDVPEPTAEEYLEHEGWEETEDPDSDLTEQVLEEHDRATGHTDDDEEFTTMPSAEDAGGDDSSDDLDDVDDQFRVEDEESESESESESPDDDASVSEGEAQAEPTGDGDEDGEFDADRFIDENWRTVASEIRSGAVDDHLEAIESAERNRPGGGRENSVLSAIMDRREGRSPDTE